MRLAVMILLAALAGALAGHCAAKLVESRWLRILQQPIKVKINGANMPDITRAVDEMLYENSSIAA